MLADDIMRRAAIKLIRELERKTTHSIRAVVHTGIIEYYLIVAFSIISLNYTLICFVSKNIELEYFTHNVANSYSI